MGLRYTCHLYRTEDATAFRHALADLASSVGRRVEWGRPGLGDEDLRLGSTPTVQSLYLPYGACDLRLLERLGERLDAPRLELRIQEGTLWDYVLYVDTRCVDTFSTLPEYWEFPEELSDEKRLDWAGQPPVLARIWQLPVATIEPYLVHWGICVDPNDSGSFHTRREGKARDADTYGYGQYDQMFDFLAALGGVEPIEQHRLAPLG